jgi:hypothetical protein
MDEHQAPNRTWLILATVLVVGLALAAGSLSLLGGQTSAILSKVGAAITEGTGPARPARDQPTPATGGGGDPGDQVAHATAVRPPELVIIRSGELELEVGNLDEAVSAANGRVDALGGYVSASEQSSAGSKSAASVTYRIPADRWEDALAAIRDGSLATKRLQVSTEAVTNQVVDLGARITNLRATEASLQAIMTKASTISDVLKVQDELSTVRGQIEQLVAEKTQLEGQAAFGTLKVTFVLPATPVVERAQRGWDPATDADRAAGTLIKVVQRTTSIAIWAGIVILPLGLALLVVGFITWRLGRWATGRGRPIAEPR